MKNSKRLDPWGRQLSEGEGYSFITKRYFYTYTDVSGKRKWLYGKDLRELRAKEKGLNRYMDDNATVNNLFIDYMNNKRNIRESTRGTYIDTYNRYVRDSLGKRNIATVKHRGIMAFYTWLHDEKGLSPGTISGIHSILHPVFRLALEDDIIGKNPCDKAFVDVFGGDTNSRHAKSRISLTVEQIRIFMGYIADHPVFWHWWPLFTILFGTGMRISECVGIRWLDVESDEYIDINHALVQCREIKEYRFAQMKSVINDPKREASRRKIPMIGVVKEAFELEKQNQLAGGGKLCQQVIDGMTGFVFQNRYGNVLNDACVNNAIKRIVNSYNKEEVENAKTEKRQPVLLPVFKCHDCRHTFTTRYGQVEKDPKVRNYVTGHECDSITEDVYMHVDAEFYKEIQLSVGKFSEYIDEAFVRPS